MTFRMEGFKTASLSEISLRIRAGARTMDGTTLVALIQLMKTVWTLFVKDDPLADNMYFFPSLVTIIR